MFKGEKTKSMMDNPEGLNRLVGGTKLNGNLSTESNLRVDGMVDGSISCKGKFVLGENGKLEGNLTAVEAEIEGEIIGDLNIDGLIILRKTARIKGAVQTGRLVIEDGAKLNGTIETGDLKKKKEDSVKNNGVSHTENGKAPEISIRKNPLEKESGIIY
jgi:cytoskeletal protein CcmA (bactofilin family)